MKNFIFGTIFGTLIFVFSISVLGNTFYADLKIEKFTHPIYINSNKWDGASECLLINSTTYVPLRMFCEETELGIEWLDKKGMSSAQIRLTTPFLRTNEVVCDMSIVEYEKGSFLREVIDKANIGDETAQGFELDTPEKAAKYVAEICNREFGKNTYYKAPWTVYFVPELNGWLVHTDLGRGNGEPFEVVVINKIGEVLFLRQYHDTN